MEKMAKKIKVSKKEVEIVRIIHDRGGSATAHEISDKSGISYITVQKYLKRLKKDKMIVSVEKGNKIEYSLNYDFIHRKEK